MKKRNIGFQDIVPFAAFIIILLFFTFASYSPRTGFRMLAPSNLITILEQGMKIYVVACGTLLIVAQGSTDLSVGVNLALSGVVGVWAGTASGIPYLVIPVTLLVGLLVGLFNGFVVAKLKVPSFMLTIAMLIGVRGLVNYIQTFIGVQRLPTELSFLTNKGFKIALFVVILVVMGYLFEFTKLGRYSRAIGENENTARFVGVPITKMKIIAFGLSGLMAGFGALFSLANVGATSQQMGTFLEMRVVTAIMLGGVLVTGGGSAKFYKILLGSFSIQIIINGLALIGRSDSYISQSVQGILLLLILALSAWAGARRRRPVESLESADKTGKTKVLDEK